MLTLGALATIALQAAAPQPPEDIPPPCSHLYMIRFDSGSASLSPIGEAILDLFPVPDSRSGPATKILVFGHADTVGGDDANLALSRRRAEAVAAHLRRAGISPSRLAIVASGERDLIEDTPDETPSVHNRVVRVVEQVPPEEMARRRAAWSAFPNIMC